MMTVATLPRVLLLLVLMTLARVTVQYSEDIGLNEEEMKEQMQTTLLQMDTDGDQQITRAELRAWVEQAHSRLPDLVATEMFSSADMDGDGRVSWKEHIKDLFKLDSDENIAKQLEGDYESRLRTIDKIKKDEELFAAADEDQDGLLNEEEHLAFIHPQNDDEMVPLLMKHHIGDRDRNGDGKLSFQEFTGSSDSHAHDFKDAITKDHFESKMDRDGDGLLDYEEMKKFFLYGNLNSTLEEAEHLLEEMDDDKDQVLSFDELMAHHRKLRSSIASQYGDHIDHLHNSREEL